MQKEIELPEEIDICGVYAIINRDNKRMYIGESSDMRKRIKAHVNLLKSGKHTCKDMQEDYNNGSRLEITELLEIPGKWNSEKRLCAEDYFIECFRHRGISLYNNDHENTKDGFFILASRNDSKINSVIKRINT